MQSLIQYLSESSRAKVKIDPIEGFGVYHSKFTLSNKGGKGNGDIAPECEVFVKSDDESGVYKLIYLKIDYWNNTLVCRVGRTHEDKIAIVVCKTDNKGGVDLGNKSAIAWVNGYKFDPIRMGGRIGYSFDSKEYKKVISAIDNKDKDFLDKVEKTIDTLREFN